MIPGTIPDEVAARVARWQPAGATAEVAAFARQVVVAAGPQNPDRAKALLYAAAKLGTFAHQRGLELAVEVCMSTSVIERYIATDGAALSAPTRRTVRSNLVALARAHRTGPAPLTLPRERAKAPYSAAQMAGYLALIDAQPTRARRLRASGLVCLSAGAGLVGADLRQVRGTDVTARSGGLVVQVRGRRPRVVPVLTRYAQRLVASADFAQESLVIGGRTLDRRTVTTPLVSSLAGGTDLDPLEVARLRATWLVAVAESIGLGAFMAAAGITCSQRLGDLVALVPPCDEAQAVSLLSGSE